MFQQDDELHFAENQDPDLERFDVLRSLLKDTPHVDFIVNYYHRNEFYLKHITESLKIVNYANENKKRAFNVIKTTRAGFTTNIIIANLMIGNKVLLVEPTNAITYDTVEEIMEVYERVTDDKSKIVRQIPSNLNGCSDVVQKIEDNEFLKVLPFVISSDCTSCDREIFDSTQFIPKATTEFCTIKTMMYEESVIDDYCPDIMSITYDKLLTLKGGVKGDFFMDLISRVDTIIFDELGSYLSKVEQGFTMKEDRTLDTLTITETLEERVEELEGFINGIEDEIYRVKMNNLIRDYVKPWMENTVNLALDFKEYPKFIENSLGGELVTISKRGRFGRVTRERMFKRDAIIEKFSELYDVLEILITDEENEPHILFLIELIEILSKRNYIVFETGGIEFKDEDEIKISKLNISGTTDELIENLERWIKKNQITIFTDATMPAYSFSMIKKKRVIDIIFGDPIKTNKQMLISRCRGIETFSVVRWHKDYKYKQKIIHYIQTMIDAFGGERFVIWCPNIKIYEELMYVFGELLKYRVCNHEEDIKNAIQFTYYNSIMTRGVKCDRRIQILLGKANKPRGSFKHVAYMQRVNWDVFDDRELRKLADANDMSINGYKQLLNNWNRELTVNGETFRTNEIPEIIKQYFEHYAESIQKEKTYSDTWQAGSRAKDALAADKSILICMGWRDSEIWEMIKWGGTRSIKYKIFAGSVLRTVEGQRTTIAPPNVIHLEFLDDIPSWLNDGVLLPRVMGFDVDLQSGIMNMLMYDKQVTSKEVWVNLSKNLGVGHKSEGSRNGYMVGAINTFRIYNNFDRYIECVKLPEGGFVFNRLEIPKTVVDKGQIGTYEMEIMLKVLKTAYLVKKEIVTFGDIRARFKNRKENWDTGLGDNEIKTAIANIVRFELLAESTWDIVTKVVTKKGKKYKEFMFRKGVAKNVMNAQKRKIMIDFAHKKYEKLVLLELLRWQTDETNLEVTAELLDHNVPEINKRHIEDILWRFKETDVLQSYNIACNIEMEEGELCVIRNIAKI